MSLHDDALFEILARCPSLATRRRAELVCKQWARVYRLLFECGTRWSERLPLTEMPMDHGVMVFYKEFGSLTATAARALLVYGPGSWQGPAVRFSSPAPIKIDITPPIATLYPPLWKRIQVQGRNGATFFAEVVDGLVCLFTAHSTGTYRDWVKVGNVVTWSDVVPGAVVDPFSFVAAAMRAMRASLGNGLLDRIHTQAQRAVLDDIEAAFHPRQFQWMLEHRPFLHFLETALAKYAAKDEQREGVWTVGDTM